MGQKFSWLDKLVTDLSNKEDDDNEQETSEMQFEDYALKTNVLAFARRSKAKAKPRRRTSACLSTRTFPICERSWTAIEPETYSPIAYPVSTQLSTLLRHGHLPREDGAIGFWRLKEYLRNEFEHSQHWSDEKWKSEMAKGGRNKKRFQHCTDPSGQEILLSPNSSRSFRTQSHWSFITVQCINPERFLRVHLSHRMCNQFTLHREFRIDTGRTEFEQKTDGILHVCGSKKNKEHKDLDVFKLDAPRLAWYKQKVWTKHQNTMYWVDIKLAQQKGFKVYQTRSNAIILYDTLPAFCIPKAIMMEKSYTRKYMRHLDHHRRFPLKTIGWKNWVQKLLEVVKTPNKPNQDQKPNY